MNLLAIAIVSYVGAVSLPSPVACQPTYCETYEVLGDGALLCFDSDEVYAEGHWAFELGPDYGDLQAVVEY